jgi:hypothetical protein
MYEVALEQVFLRVFRFSPVSNARNGNLEVPVYFLKRNNDIPSQEWKQDKWI